MGHVVPSVIVNDMNPCLSLTQIFSTPHRYDLYWSLAAMTSMFFHMLEIDYPCFKFVTPMVE
jgi:hypothetical protein